MPTPGLHRQCAADNAADPFLDLITITHPDLAPDVLAELRWVREKVAVTSRGQVYKPFPFDITPPGDGEDGPTTPRVTIDYVAPFISRSTRACACKP